MTKRRRRPGDRGGTRRESGNGRDTGRCGVLGNRRRQRRVRRRPGRCVCDRLSGRRRHFWTLSCWLFGMLTIIALRAGGLGLVAVAHRQHLGTLHPFCAVVA